MLAATYYSSVASNTKSLLPVVCSLTCVLFQKHQPYWMFPNLPAFFRIKLKSCLGKCHDTRSSLCTVSSQDSAACNVTKKNIFRNSFPICSFFFSCPRFLTQNLSDPHFPLSDGENGKSRRSLPSEWLKRLLPLTLTGSTPCHMVKIRGISLCFLSWEPLLEL